MAVDLCPPARQGALRQVNAMSTQNNLHVPDELLAELQAKTAAEGKTVDELAEDALRKGLEELS